MRLCPFNDCVKRLPDHIFACRKHWFALLPCDRWRINDAYAAYQRNEIDIVRLREIQQEVLGNRGQA